MDGDLRMLLFDAYHDEYRGVICLVEVVDGALKLGDRVQAMSTGDLHDVLEVRTEGFEDYNEAFFCDGEVAHLVLK